MNAVILLCFASSLSLALAASCKCRFRKGATGPTTPTTTPNGPPPPTTTTQNGTTTQCSDVPCNVTADCQGLGANSSCTAGKCLCTRGFHLNSSCVCIRECTTYGDTYIQYNETGIVCFPALDDIVTGVDLDNCTERCNSNNQCISFGFDISGSCLINACDTLDNLLGSPDTVLIVSDPNATLFVRNCVE